MWKILNPGPSRETFLVAFAKLWEVAICFIMFVYMEQLGFHWMDFHEI